MSEYVREIIQSNFDQEVLRSDRPVLVDFWAAWCAPCRMLAPTMEAVAKQYADRARVLKLNVDDNPVLAQQYGIRGVPTLILFNNGEAQERIVGVKSQAEIAGLLDKYLLTASV